MNESFRGGEDDSPRHLTVCGNHIVDTSDSSSFLCTQLRSFYNNTYFLKNLFINTKAILTDFILKKVR